MQYGVLLILDEVRTGLGRTGTFWFYEQEGAVPGLLLPEHRERQAARLDAQPEEGAGATRVASEVLMPNTSTAAHVRPRFQTRPVGAPRTLPEAMVPTRSTEVAPRL